MDYKKELAMKLRDVKLKIKNKQREVTLTPASDKNFMQKYKELNELRIDKLTIESRIKNLNNKNVVLDHAKISNQ